ncbi:alpha/beta fold hydrolase [Streptomyces sp. NBC_00513]|uniref:thioesterase II family protein n=1 Tax=unclassified Streptomyces TaxID=2593676 RepID=UPI00225985FC|nr:alpha/beta fold hydrolase [Streptomyces sp. NBC_00424]MCX5071067.1 alpha/beta fold hydrolase [Streptomyces sp. NBC_00424]WUD45505.1 alpha/beta fold hydrolase [Streptomyces sp. NBC_00513]
MTTHPSPHDESLWIRRFRPRPDGSVRLVCLPHAGGSASFYLPLARTMPDFVDVLCVQYPGRQDRRTEPLVDSVPELADQVFTALLPWADRPLAFFGHSMGASVAYEVARRFEREKGVVAAALFASGRRAPSAPRHETAHLLDDRGLIEEVKSLSGTDTQLLGDDEVLRMVLPAIRADYRAAETYAPEPAEPLHCPLIAMIGSEDPKVTEAEAAAWATHTEGPFTLRVFSRGHFYLVRDQAEVIETMATHLRARHT